MASRERVRVQNNHTANAYGIPAGESGFLEPWQAIEMCDRLKYGKRVDGDHRGPKATEAEEMERLAKEKAAHHSGLERENAELRARVEDAEGAVEALEVENAALLAQVESLTVNAKPAAPEAPQVKGVTLGRFTAPTAPATPPPPPSAEAPPAE